MFVYKITNKLNNKCYIGQTIHQTEERYFNVKPKSFSNKASKKPQTFIYNYEYQISKYYD